MPPNVPAGIDGSGLSANFGIPTDPLEAYGANMFARFWGVGPRRGRPRNPFGLITRFAEAVRESVGPSTRPRFPRPRGLATKAQLDEQLRRARDRTREMGHQVEPEFIPRADKPPSPKAPRVFENGVLKDIPGIAGGPVTSRPVQSDTRRANPIRGGFKPMRGDLAGAWTFLGDTLYQEASRRLDEQWRRRRAILSTNRRGALASRVRPGSPGTTNRSGAKSTRPLQPVPTTPVIPTAIPGIAKPVPNTGTATSGNARRDSAPVSRDAEARRIMERSPAMPRSVPRTSSKSQTTRGIQTQARAWVENFLLRRAFPQTRQRVQSRGSARVDTQSAFATQLLTGVNTATLALSQPQTALATLTGSRTATSTRSKQRECECDEKRKKQTEPRCRNPVVSKRQRGDLLTITRRIQCPQSRSK